VGEQTKIEWCDSTWNPWVGCTAIAPACTFCYAEAWSKRSGMVEWGNNPRRRTSAALWRNPVKWQADAAAFYAEHGRRRRVFCASLADVFDNQVPTEWRDDLWALIRVTPDIDWLLLTKRPQNIAKMKPGFWDEVKGHIWLGTTVQDQKHADENIPHLLKHDSAVRFISAEPLLGPIDLEAMPFDDGDARHHWSALTGQALMYASGIGGQPDFTVRIDKPLRGKLDWVIAGGESGPHARPSSIQWYRSLRDQCAATGVPFLFKQWGEWHPARGRPADEPGRFAFGDYEYDPARMVLASGYPRQFTMFGARSVVEWVGKKHAGRHLDGALHDGFPA
jgi:protein gp37